MDKKKSAYDALLSHFGIQIKRIGIFHSIPVSRAILFLLFFITVLSGCIRSGKLLRVPVEIGNAFSVAGEAELPDKWWEALGDQKLNGIIEKALKSNLDLRSAWQRLHAARAAAGREAASLYPEIDAELSGETGRSETGQDIRNDLGIELSLGYELDLWGRIRSDIEAQQFETKAVLTDYQTVALSVSAELALTWFRLTDAQAQIDMIGDQIGTNEKMLRLIRARVGTGQVRSVDILRQKQLIESTIEQKISWESRAAVLQNQLSVLRGISPGYVPEVSPERLPEIPPIPVTGIPAELIRRRPDVKSAFYRLRSADHRLGSAVRSLYPRLSIQASASSTNTYSNNLLKNWARSLVANLLAPVFRGGRLRAEVRRTRAVREQALYEYGSKVLNAVLEVENALVAETKQAEIIKSLEKQRELVRTTLGQLRSEYFNGISDYLDVLTVMREEQQLSRKILSSYLERMEYRILLYRALAGGFKTGMEQENDRK